jgi:nucleotide-binding universal stress UspA family protein
VYNRGKESQLITILKGVNGMKMLVCTDGSEHSQKALEKASKIASAPGIEELAVINVYDSKMDLHTSAWGSRDFAVTETDIKRLREMHEEQKEVRKKMLDDAVRYLAEKGITARAILKEGHPSHTIVNVAEEEGFDTIVIGSRGLGGLKKLLLGSVSNAVAQEAVNCTVIIVK